MSGAGEYGALLDALRGVHWPARRAVSSPIAGAHHARLHGISPEFTEYRAYRQGDDPRRIDWKLLGRTDRVSIRLANDRAILTTIIVIDGSASMAFPTPSLEKWRQACRIALGLGAIAHMDGDPVGLLVATGEAVHSLPPRSRRGVLSGMARTLERTRPSGHPSLAGAVQRARGAARVAIISDFLSDETTVLRAAREQASGGGEVHAVHLVAREELEPPARDVLAVDPEDASVRRPLVGAAREPYDASFRSWRDALARAWRGAGAAFTMVVSDERPERAVRRIVAPGTAVRDTGS